MPDKNKFIRRLLLALLLFIPSNTRSEEANMLSAQSTVGDILRQPEFQGFAAKLLPWDNLPANDPSTPLSRIDSLMPYHNNISISDILAPLNKMITDVRQGKQVFYDFYPAGDSKRQHTGLFFFAGKPGAPFAVICPGGGFSYVGSLHEGFPLALKLSQKGFNAFVIKYRSGSADFALQDLSQALEYIFANARKLNITTANYSLWGGSAGARMAAYIGSYGTAAFGGKNLPRPAAVIMAYTGHRDFSSLQPPTFMVVGENDWIANPEAMRRQAENLNRRGIKTEFHAYPRLGHGFGLGTGTSAEGWIDLAIDFWQNNSL